MSKTKFNGFENYFITKAIAHAIEEAEAEITEMIKQGKRPIFAKGYFNLVGEELIEKIHTMTLKKTNKN